MPEGRPSIPAPMKRALMEEAGYRCAIQTCKSTEALEFAHIVPWSEVREHDFENLIVLCANDHYRYDNGRIPRKSIEAFKANLGLLRSRYSDAERRMLEAFASEPPEYWEGRYFPIAGGTSYTMMYLVKDGLVEIESNSGIVMSGIPAWESVSLTPKGIEVVRRLKEAQAIDGTV